MDATTVLTTILPVIVVVSALLTAIASLWLLRRYRRAVLRGMNTGSGAAPVQLPAATPPVARPPLALAYLEPGSADLPAGREPGPFREASASLRRLGLVYGVAGLAYALVMSIPWMLSAGDGLPVMRLLWLVAVYFWPAVMAWLLVATETPRQRALVLGAYAVTIVAVGTLALMRNSELSPGQLAFLWLFANGAATALAAAFLGRRVRAVGPLVLAFMVAAVSGAFLAVTLVGASDPLLRAAAAAGSALELGATAVFVLLHLAGFALFALLGWWLLGRLGRAYRNKRMSDQSLAVDALWLLFAVMQSFTLAFEGWGWVFTGLVGFVLYRALASAGFARLSTSADAAAPPGLLLLRVFALGRRSERLFNALSLRWLRAGSIDLIAGPDLLTSTVEPHEFLDFIGGRLSRQFIGDAGTLEQRLDARDRQPDPDGRYRVNEFFCRQDTWQLTMRRLAADNDVVLMDLRSFSPDNQGCLWELEQLLAQVPLDRTLLLTDETSDRAFLEEKIQATWRDLPGDAPNASAEHPVLSLFVASGSTAVNARALAASLFESVSRE